MRAKIKITIKFIVCLAVVIAVTGTPIEALCAELRLIPIGSTVGIKLRSEGVMVVGIPPNMKDGGGESPAKSAGIRAGDIIIQIGSMQIQTREDLKKAVDSLDGKPVSIKVVRSGKTIQLTITPYGSNDCYELGLWIRDGIAGIGTVTFYNPETGEYGALGHSVSDAEAGIVLPLKDGVIARASVSDVVVGQPGSPGQLQGSFDFDNVLGTVTQNLSSGIFGKLKAAEFASGHEAVTVADSSEIRTGAATILANVAGTEVKEYAIEISRIYSGDESKERSMMITVTDSSLIAATGGIVQGMSGSPIIQDGKLVGAVTHVLVNDPKKGYAISIEKMLESVSKGVSLIAA